MIPRVLNLAGRVSLYTYTFCIVYSQLARP